MTNTPIPLVLASASPRRRGLLRSLDIAFEVIPSHADESTPTGMAPDEMVAMLATRKASSVAEDRAGAIVLGADTTVVIDGQILNKPVDRTDAGRMLRMLRARPHRVHSGIAVVSPGMPPETAVMRSTVWMRRFPDEELETYLDTGESMDKAGAYGIQGAAGDIIDSVDGCYTNVVGLPLCATARLLMEAGLEIGGPAPRCGFRSGRICPWWPSGS